MIGSSDVENGHEKDSVGSTLDVGATLTYHSSHGRLETVTGDFNGATSLFTYTYTANSSLVSTITGPAYLAGHAWDATRDIMTTRDNHFITAYVYDVNDLGQRTANTYTNPWTWHYDAKGQVVSAQRSGSSAMSSVYEFDGIGNRKKSAAGSTLPGSDNYTANALNQYTAVAGGSPTYDDDGNLTADAGLNPAAVARLYEWEGGNRLDKVRTASSGTVTATFLYDAYGRRVSKTAGSTTTIFCYDGWNLIAESTSTGGTPALARSHTWGLDLSGTMQGAGGVGGLLATRIVGSGTYYPCYDGNGNVMQYVNSAGTIVVAYEYGPFGSMVYANDPLGLQFRICFSTKYQDGETGWYYYGYRYYDAQLGRWPSRDPIEEEGGVNLYGFIRNDVVGASDILGLDRWVNSDGGVPEHLGIVIKNPKSKTGYTRFDMSIGGLAEGETEKPEGPPSVVTDESEDESAINSIHEMNLTWLDYATISRNCRYYAFLFEVLGLAEVEEASWEIAIPIISGSIAPESRRPQPPETPKPNGYEAGRNGWRLTEQWGGICRWIN